MTVDALLEPGTVIPELAPTAANGISAPRLMASTQEESDSAVAALAATEGALQDELDRSLPVASSMLQRHLAARGSGHMGAGSLAVRSDAGSNVLTGLMMFAQGPGGPRNVGAAFVADPLALLAVGGERAAVHWTLLPGGPSVTARANALRILRLLSAPGELVFGFDGRDPLPPLQFDGGDWHEENEWRLFEDLATIEEWTGVDLPMPAAVSVEEAVRAAQAALWARTQRVRALVNGFLRFRLNTAINEPPSEVRLHQSFDTRVLGIDLDMGHGWTSLKLADATAISERSDGHWMSATPQDRELVLWLDPPDGRRLPPRRTPLTRVPTPGALKKSLWIGVPIARRASRSLKAVLATGTTGAVGQDAASLGTVLDAIREDRDL